jgi:hypothetical protein
VQRVCKRCHIKLINCPDKFITLNENGKQEQVLAYFYEDLQGTPVFGYATGLPVAEWFPIMVHEFQFAEQWIAKFPPYMSLAQHQDLFKWIDRKIDLPSEKVHAAIKAYREVNQDASKHALKTIVKYQLPIDPKLYAKVANSYLYQLQYIERFQQWPSCNRQPFMIKEIIDAMPTEIVEDLETVNEKILALYVEAFPPASPMPKAKRDCLLL